MLEVIEIVLDLDNLGLEALIRLDRRLLRVVGRLVRIAANLVLRNRNGAVLRERAEGRE